MSSHKSTPKAILDMKRQVEKLTGKNVETGVPERLVDFQYEFVSQMIADARQISQYLGKKELDIDDFRLANELTEKESHPHSRPSKQMLSKNAQKINEVPLPTIKPSFGLRLPPDRFCMTQTNFQTLGVPSHADEPHTNGTV